MTEPKLRETMLRDNIWVFSLGGASITTSFGANCTAVAGREAVLLVDPLIAPSYARLVEAAVRKRTDLPVRFVVLTHHHTDHALGAGYFGGRGAVVVAHRACRDRMAAEHARLIEERRRQPEIAELFRDAEPYLPSLTFEEGLSLDLGGSQASVVYPGHGHTPGDALVHLRDESVVICGDLISSGYHVNYEDAAVENLARGLDVLRAFCARTYIPGHGLAGGPDQIDAQARYHADVKRIVEGGADETETRRRVLRDYPEYLLTQVIPSTFSALRRG